MTVRLFKVYSWTWGIIMTLIGYAVAAVLKMRGYEPHKWAGTTYFMMGKNWGGLNLGPISIVDDTPTSYILTHEFGHAVQNCKWGPMFPFVVAIPSAIRYWYRNLVVRFGIKKYEDLPGYYTIWFEKEASELGQKYIDLWKEM